MKSNAPWSVKGIERDARATAKEAARREGMTVGEWLSQVIQTAGDPASSDGEIEGLKISDLVKAIEHLNKRVIHAEFKSAAALDDLARNFAGAVERMQRLERVKPGEGDPDLEDRLQRIEGKLGDRHRIDALRALEKAVSQAALQFDAVQKLSATRLDATEKQMQELASRLDLAGAVADGGEGDSAPAGELKHLIDELSYRVARSERMAAEAGERSIGGAAVDSEFADRTGARLRVLGDEIKRGGDQIRSLESVIKKLSDQIDAAERRSSEGVQKVEETISELRTQVAQYDGGVDTRREIDAAIAAAAERAEERIAGLKRSLEAATARRNLPGDEPIAEAEAPIEPEAEPAMIEFSKPTPVEDAAADADAHDADEDIDDDIEDDDIEYETEPFDLDAEEGGDGDLRDDPDGDAFAFDLDKDAEPTAEDAEADAAQDILQEVKDAFDGEPQRAKPDLEPAPQDGLDAILAELEGFSSARADLDDAETLAEIEDDDPAFEGHAPEGLFLDESTSGEAGDQPDNAPTSGDFLKQARRVAKEAAVRDAVEVATRRKLTPKQRAILAAKIKRKRLMEQAASPAQEPPREPSPIIAVKSPPNDESSSDRPSPFAWALTAVKGVQAKFRNSPEGGESGSGDTLVVRRGKLATDANDVNPNITKAARMALRRLKARPITIALGAAILLAAAALYFLVKDLIFAGNPNPLQEAREPSSAALVQSSAPQLKEPGSPEATLTQSRALYVESVARLKAAKSDGELRAAVKGLQEAAALGHPPAQLQLGELYKLGQGVPQDPAEARLWYERAANGGNVLAMHRMGVMEARGQGGPADQSAAIAWFEKASNFGLVDSQYNLGAIYHPGGDGPLSGAQDAAKAFYWYALASKNGDQQAGVLANGLASGLPAARRKALEAEVAKWAAAAPDVAANEIAPAS